MPNERWLTVSERFVAAVLRLWFFEYAMMWKLPGTRFTSKKPETRHPGWSVFQLMAWAFSARAREREASRARA